MSKNNPPIDNPKKEKPVFLLGKTNFKILIAGLITIAVGYILMSGGASTDPNVFNEDIFNFRRIRLAPTIVLIGFGIVFYSIYYTKKQK
jgi:hypothetical protein